MKTFPVALAAFLLVTLLTMGGVAFAEDAPTSSGKVAPIVSTEWLHQNSRLKDLVILDVRSKEEYAGGHIPGAVNVPFQVPVSAWIVMRDELLLELPDDAALFNTIGSCGIKPDSRVVIVTSAPKPGEPPYSIANATRVAATLVYAGVPSASILDGGHDRWQKENRSISKEPASPSTVTFKGKPRKSMFVSREYVKERIGKALIIDARDADVYFGVTVEPFAGKPGHIRTAKSFPAPWTWNPKDWTYKDPKTLKAMAAGITGKKKPEEIILYCGVGGYASTAWFVLAQALGYKSVKIYDGAAQEWVRKYDMVPYQWE
jgi:thiosulfate/3-mercaptopyruvate sulfurtransferase